jgi:uncharacterized membrane protein YcaP (DUF421 family)
MKDFLYRAFGEGKDLEWWQMLDRAIVIFLLAIFLLRLSGRRSFGMKSPLDNTIVILLGATLSRALVGVSPFIPTVVACLGLVLLHRAFAWISLRSHTFGRLIKGKAIPVYKDGKFDQDNMRRSLISESDIREGLRKSLNTENLDRVDTILLERGGSLSIIEKEE